MDFPIILYNIDKQIITKKLISKTNCFYFYSYKNISVRILSGIGVLYSVKKINNILSTEEALNGETLIDNFGYTLYLPINKTSIEIEITMDNIISIYNITLNLDNIIDETNEHYKDLLYNNHLPNFAELEKAIPDEFNKSELIKRLLLDFKYILKHKGTKKSIETFLEFIGFNDSNLSIYEEFLNRPTNTLNINPNKETDIKTGNYHVLYDNWESEVKYDSNNLPIRKTKIDALDSFKNHLLYAISLANTYFTSDEQDITFFGLTYSSNIPYEQSITSNMNMIFENDVYGFRKNIKIDILNYVDSINYSKIISNCIQNTNNLFKTEVKSYLEDLNSKINTNTYNIDYEIFDDVIPTDIDITKVEKLFGNILHIDINSPNTYIEIEIIDKLDSQNILIYDKIFIQTLLSKVIVLKKTSEYLISIKVTDCYNNIEKYFYDFNVNIDIQRIDIESFTSFKIQDSLNDLDIIDSPSFMTGVKKINEIEIKKSKYGRLYNWYAATDPRCIAPEGWHIPSIQDWINLTIFISGDYTFTGSDVNGGEKIKTIGIEYWNTSDYIDLVTNNTNFNAVGAGVYNGSFTNIKDTCNYLVSDDMGSAFAIRSYNNKVSFTSYNPSFGSPVRYIKNNSINDGNFTDIDGNIYHAVTIGTQVWSQENAATLHYNDGSLILSDFNGTIGAVCSYNNDESNVYEIVIDKVITNVLTNYVLPIELIPNDLSQYFNVDSNNQQILKWLTDNKTYVLPSLNDNLILDDISEKIPLELTDNWLSILCFKYDDNYELKLRIFDPNINEYIIINYSEISNYNKIFDCLYIMLLDIYDRDENNILQDFKTPYYFITTTEVGIDLNKLTFDFVLVNKLDNSFQSIYDILNTTIESFENKIPVNYDFPLFEIKSELFPIFNTYKSLTGYIKTIEIPEQSIGIDKKVSKYGRLYNWFAIDDIRDIAPIGWDIANIWLLVTTIPEDGCALREVGTEHWTYTDNPGNSKYSLNLLPGGHFKNDYILDINGIPVYPTGFFGIKTACNFWIRDGINTGLSNPNLTYINVNGESYPCGRVYNLSNKMNSNGLVLSEYVKSASSVRLVMKDSSSWVEGDTVTDIDGNIYGTTNILGKIYTTENLAVIHYSNGDLIGTDFNGNIGAVCSYDFDETNVYDIISNSETIPASSITFPVVKSIFPRLIKISDENPDACYNLKLGDIFVCELDNKYVINEQDINWKIINSFTNDILFETTDLTLKYRIDDNICYDISCDFIIDSINYNIFKKSLFSSFNKIIY